MKRIILCLLLVFTMILSACSADVQTDTVKGSAIAFQIAEEKDIDYSCFEGLLSEVACGAGKSCTYSAYDIDNDGIRELIIKIGTCEADCFYHFYALNKELYPVELGKIQGSHSVLYAAEEKAGIILASGSMGYQTVTHISVQNGAIVTCVIEEGECGGDYYSNRFPLSVCFVTDKYLLEKNAQLTGRELDNSDCIFDPGKLSQFITLSSTSTAIDMSFDLVCKNSSSPIFECGLANIRNIPVALTPSQKLYTVMGNSTEYMIVEDGIVVGYILYNGSVMRNMSMKQYFPSDECFEIAPLIARDGTHTYCCWALENSYMILGAIVNESADESRYFDWPTTMLIFLKDFSQFTFSDRIQ